jgi:GDPmannose 4,6-dehydratase
MWRMLQQDKPDDYVVATGISYTVQQFVEFAFAELGLDWNRHVEIDPRYFRPTEVDHLEGENAKARRVLAWEPKVTLPELVKMMVHADHALAQQERLLNSAGHNTPLRGAAHG